MRILHHFPLDPGCRFVRLLLQEKGIDFELSLEKVWESRPEFLTLNPSGDVPVWVDEEGAVICGSPLVIAEYLEETFPTLGDFLGKGAQVRAEVRRLVAWFEGKFRREVTSHLVDEKLMKRFQRLGEPNSEAIRTGYAKIHEHLDYIGELCDRRTWLAGDDLSLADMSAAAHLSCLDYLGDVPWAGHPGAKDWYARFKSRPSMRTVLADAIPGLPPSQDYSNLDF